MDGHASLSVRPVQWPRIDANLVRAYLMTSRLVTLQAAVWSSQLQTRSGASSGAPYKSVPKHYFPALLAHLILRLHCNRPTSGKLLPLYPARSLYLLQLATVMNTSNLQTNAHVATSHTSQQHVWDHLAQGREKWHDFMMAFLQPMGEEIIAALHLRDTDTVLDLATGTGEPGISIAARVNRGTVIGADLSADMLEVARRKARQAGVSNYHPLACEASALPFADNTFDGISCRNGYMFFSDLPKATQELVRVLKPGRRLAISVWGTAENNPWVTLPLAIIRANGNTFYSESVSLFRCADSNLLVELFREAGLKGVTPKRIRGSITYPSGEAYWQFITQVTAPVVLALNQLDRLTQLRIKDALLRFLPKRSLAGKVVFDYEALVISGQK